MTISTPHIHSHGRFARAAFLLLVLISLALGALPARAQAPATRRARLEVVNPSVRWSAAQAAPGDQLVLAVVLDIAPTYHINPGAVPKDMPMLIPTKLAPAEAPPSLRVGAVQYPEPVTVDVSYTDKPLLAYEGRVVLYLPVVVAESAAPGQVDLKLKLTTQACDDRQCLPPRTVELPVSLVVVAQKAPSPPLDPEVFGGFDGSVFASLAAGKVAQRVNLGAFGWDLEVDPSGPAGLAALLLLAAGGGFLLNLTPCVLPLVPIKVMSLSRAAGNRGRCIALGVAMSIGVVSFWLGLAVAMSAIANLRAANQLFQYPWFTIAVGVVIAVMAVGMCGLFTVRLPQWVYAITPEQETYGGSVLFGVMTAVLSTPCTAPLMGAAAAWAVTQPPATTLATFAAIGAGMALPYLLLAAFPALIAKVPRTGPASELVKQVMGLLMLAAAAYFIGAGISGWLKGEFEPPTSAYWWAVMALVALAGAWLGYRAVRITRSPLRRAACVAAGAVVVVSAGAAAVRLTEKGPIEWVYYTPDRLRGAMARGDAVVLDFTAEWCLNCKALETTVLNRDAVARALAGDGVVPMKVDLTSDANEAGTAMLREIGRVTIPALVVLAPDGRQVLNADAYTPEQVISAVREAQGR